MLHATTPDALPAASLLPSIALIEDRLTRNQRERLILRSLQRLALRAAEYGSRDMNSYRHLETK
jgi:hypothetical protein